MCAFETLSTMIIYKTISKLSTITAISITRKLPLELPHLPTFVRNVENLATSSRTVQWNQG